MTMTRLVSLGFGLALGVAVGVGGMAWIGSDGAPTAKATRDPLTSKFASVLVARTDLHFGSRLASANLEWATMPHEEVPPGAFVSFEELFGYDGSLPRYVLRPVAAGQPVRSFQVTAPGQPTGMVMWVSDRRPDSVEVDATAVPVGLVEGDRVDVLVTGWKLERRTTTALTGVTVVSVDDKGDKACAGTWLRRKVRIDVHMNQVPILAQARSNGSLSLSKRIGGPAREPGGLRGRTRVIEPLPAPPPR